METFTPRLEALPASQRQLWPDLRPLQELGFVLYGGTAIALRLGHRQSVDFDFFTSRPIDREALRRTVPLLGFAAIRQDKGNTFEVMTESKVKVSFFGGLDFGRVGQPQRTSDGVLRVASLDDLMATKLKVILQRSEAKDYQDIAAMIRAGVRVDIGLAAAERMFQPTFPPKESLKAMVYFEGGDLVNLAASDRTTLTEAAKKVRMLPQIVHEPDLALNLPVAASHSTFPIHPRTDPTGPRVRM